MRVLLVCFRPLETQLGGQSTYVHALSHGIASLNVKIFVLGLKEGRPNMPKIFIYDRKIVHYYSAGIFTDSLLEVFSNCLSLLDHTFTYLEELILYKQMDLSIVSW
ncbi:hypothetical protein KEJ18_02200 [Candidatus Bathyarchaeota archaeon]|nr:hypothetical protein [Candidatus Bathyarchaeota archaeon]